MAVVELLPDRARELVDEGPRVDEVERADALLREPRGLVEQRQVGLDLPRGAGALHLDRDLPPVRQRRAVHLTDRRSGERRLVEVEEEALEREPSVSIASRACSNGNGRTSSWSERSSAMTSGGRYEIGAHREELAELHERGTQLVEHLAEVAATLDVASGVTSGRERPNRSVSLCRSKK